MPSARHVWSTSVRVTEVGVHGAVAPARIVDWLQDAAADHCHEAGWSVDRLRAAGSVWFVRDLALDLSKPAHHRDPITVQTWVSDLRRFRTHREYLVTRGDEVIARAQADWLFLAQTASGGLRPKRPPETMKDSFPFEALSALHGVDPLPWPDGDGPGPELAGVPLERRVMPSELDENGHVNHSNYLAWIEDHADGFGLGPLQRVRMEFLDDVAAGETVVVSARARADGATFDVEITRGEDRLVRAVALRGSAG